MRRKRSTKNDSQFADFLSDLVARFDPQFRHTYVNSAVEHFTGRRSQDVVGKTNNELGMPPEFVSRWEEALGYVFRTGVSKDITFSLSRPDGNHYYHSRLIPEKMPSGHVTSVTSFARDETGAGPTIADNLNKEFEAERYRAILESTDDAIIGKTLDGIVTSWNPAAEVMFGYAAEEMLGQSVLRLFTPDRIVEEEFIVEKLRYGEKIDHFETVRVHKSGRLIHVSVTTSPIRNSKGEIVGASKIARDITPLKVERERLRLAMDAASNGLWDWNVITGAVYRSERYLKIAGYAPEDDTHDFEFFKRMVHPEDLPRALGSINDFLQGDSQRIEFDYRVVSKTGSTGIWVRACGQAVEHDSDGAPTRIVGTLSDVTQSRQMYADLLDREKRLTRVIDGSDQGYWDWNVQTNALEVSPRWATMLGYGMDEIDASSGPFRQYVHPDDFESVMATVQRHLQGELPNLEAEIRCRTKAGDWTWILTRGRIVEWDAEGKPLMVSGTHTDISQFKAHEAELYRVAHYDPLTGTPNRRLLADRLQQAIVRADRNQKTLAVCYLDLDGFKEINDRHGHKAGDDLLIGISENLKHVLRSEDTLSRLGGDEFVLLLYDIGTPQECSVILDRILHAIKLPVTTNAAIVSVSASIGVSLYPQDNSDADTLLRHADQAMYRAKEAGKNRFHLFDPESDQKAQQHRRMVDRMHKAMVNGEFRLFYQPKVNLSTGAIVGMEALIRWQHPEEGLLSPSAFLPYVEGSTLDHPLGKWVISNALDQVAQWMQQGYPLKVSVNVGAHHLLHPGFLDDLREALSHHPDLPADCLELEVLESVTISDMKHTVQVLDECHRIGVKLALDDFGTGYSSLTYLRKLPVDVLKIDQSFVRDMLTDSEDLGIVEAVIRLGHSFNRQVIAEGVETFAHGTALLRMGCQLAQGYGIARPMPKEEVLVWIRQWTKQSPWTQFLL